MSRTARGALAWLLLLAAFLAPRVALLERHSLWADEFFSLAMATGHSLEHPPAQADPALGDFVEDPAPLPASAYARYLDHDDPPASAARVSRAVRLSDTNPPLYYVLLSWWTRAFGTSALALRGFSLLAGLATLPLVAALAFRAGGRAAVAPAALLFALLPASVYYTTEGRMYALLGLEAAAAALLALGLRRERAWPWRLPALVLVTAAGALTHYFFVFVIAAIGAALLWRPGRRSRLEVVLAGVAIGALVFPWYRELPAALDAWRVTKGWLEVRPDDFHRSLAIPALPWSWFSIRGPWGVTRKEALLQGILLAIVAIVAVRRLGLRWLAPRRATLGLIALAACLGLVVLDVVQRTYLVDVPRYAFTGMPAAVALAGVAFATLAPRPRALLLAGVVLASCYGLHRIHSTRARIWEAYDEVAARVVARTGPDDLVVVHSIPSGIAGFARACVAANGAQTRVLSWVTQLGTRRSDADLARACEGATRILHVSIHGVHSLPTALDWLEQHARRLRGGRVLQARIAEFEPLAGDRF